MSASLVAMAIAAGLATSNVPIESVSLHAGNGSRVAGRLTYHAAGQGTAVSVRISGLAPGASVRVLFEAGACARHGASFALAGSGRAAADGTFTQHGRLLFHGLPVGIGTVADGKHVFTLVVAGEQRACARIPGMD